MEEILDLRRGKPESSESIVADSVEIEAPKLST
jgi:hypothetical protein